MGILDDAIREHLDLKRRHGAREAEIREIEDEALGSGDQPDPFAAGGELFSGPSAGEEAPTRLVEPEALRPEPEEAVSPQEPVSPREEPVSPREEPVSPREEPVSPREEPVSPPEEPVSPPEGLAPIPGQTELPGADEVPGQERLDQPIEGYRPSEEPRREPATPAESLEELIAEEEPFPQDSAAPAPDTAEPPGPSADLGGALAPPASAPPPGPAEPEPAEPEQAEEPPPEPESSVPDPPPPPPEAGAEPPGRARGRVDVPTQEHPPPGETGDLPPYPSEREGRPVEDSVEKPASEGLPLEESEPAEKPELETAAPELYDFETDDDPLATERAQDDDFDALGPAEEEGPYLEEEQPYPDEPSPGAGAPLDEPGTEVRPAIDDESDEFGALDPQEADGENEEDDLWFEKGPPKDFDFDD
jgi:hypothetical protein